MKSHLGKSYLLAQPYTYKAVILECMNKTSWNLIHSIKYNFRLEKCMANCMPQSYIIKINMPLKSRNWDKQILR